ncbi:NUDIX hydrolase [Kushneria pakistanensis]|nr:NAD regulator [Kushneria pakistanensis]
MPDSAVIAIELSAVVVAMDSATPAVLLTHPDDRCRAPMLPAGDFDPRQHRTFELGLRDRVARQTGLALDYVEQLYTFGDQGRLESDMPDQEITRHISIGHLGLVSHRQTLLDEHAVWASWYDHFPWEDYRHGRPAMIDMIIAPALTRWIDGSEDTAQRDARRQRAQLAFGLNGARWVDTRVLERFELLYEAGLAPEAQRHANTEVVTTLPGQPLMSDHRRILATAMDRLRGKLRYRPVVFDLLPEHFTLSQLQLTIEAIIGCRLHKQNFRRALDRTGLVVPTGAVDTTTGGRPAERFRFCREQWRQQMAPGVQTPLAHSEYQ